MVRQTDQNKRERERERERKKEKEIERERDRHKEIEREIVMLRERERARKNQTDRLSRIQTHLRFSFARIIETATRATTTRVIVMKFTMVKTS